MSDSVTIKCHLESGAEVDAWFGQVVKDIYAESFDDVARGLPNAAKKTFEQNCRAAVETVFSEGTNVALKLSWDEILDPVHGPSHLLGMILGEAFSRSISGKQFPVTVSDIAYDHSAGTYFSGGTRWRIAEMIGAFRGGESGPLLAYSVKPRLGLDWDQYSELCLQAAEGGCDIVEMDTRFLVDPKEDFGRYIELACRIDEKGKQRGGVARFSPNLTMASGRIIDFASQLQDAVGDPVVIKIDVGLDGLSTLCRLRRELRDSDFRPIVTCYPLLAYLGATRINPRALVRLIGLCGADILYPTGSPKVSAQHLISPGNSEVEAVNWYRSFISSEGPMPTAAGGIHIGQVHSYIEMLGTNFAFFVGGGLASHSYGAGYAAKQWRDLIDTSVKFLGEEVPPKDLKRIEGIVGDFQKASGDNAIYSYVNPTSMDARLRYRK